MDGGFSNPDNFLDFSQYNNTSNSSSPALGLSTVFDSRPDSPYFNPASFLAFQDPPYFIGAPTFTNAPAPVTPAPSYVLPPYVGPPQTPSPPHHSSNLSTPSPPQLSSGTPSPPQVPISSGPPPSKRKRTAKEDLLKINNSIAWEDYLPPDTQRAQLLSNLTPVDTSLHIGHIDKNAIVEPEKCIIYRQNQFKLQGMFTSGLQNYSTPVSRDHPLPSAQHIVAMIDNRLFEIDGLYTKLYAFKQMGDETTEEFKVPIHQVGPSRTKKETKPPEIMPITNGAVLFDKLQFQASTHVGSDCYFRIVITVLARILDKHHIVSAKISPKLLVRAQNPGRYTAAQKPQTIPQPLGGINTSPETDHSSQDEHIDATALNTMARAPSPPQLVPSNPQTCPLQSQPQLTPPQVLTTSTPPQFIPSHPIAPKEENHSPPNASSVPASWVKEGNVVHYFGKVGINTTTPHEALTVNGNVLVTGDICKPSDRRLKQNFAEVNPAAQLNVINKINIYDYDVQAPGGYRKERGVIAQELAQVLPHAVHRLSSYQAQNGQTLDNLLVVNERMLLMENIGATQYLDQVVRMEREELDYVNTKVDELEQEEQHNSSYVMKTISNMGSLLMSEDFKETANSGMIYCGFSICGLGPAWSMFLIGFFFFPSWFLGALYVSSRNPVKRAAGVANACMVCLAVLAFISVMITPKKRPFQTLIGIVVLTGVIFLTVISLYKRNRERLREKVLKKNLRSNLQNIPLDASKKREPNYSFPQRMGSETSDGGAFVFRAPPSYQNITSRGQHMRDSMMDEHMRDTSMEQHMSESPHAQGLSKGESEPKISTPLMTRRERDEKMS